VHPDHAAIVGLVRAAVFLARLGQWERVPGGELLANFEELEGDVTITNFTQHESPLIVPGQECDYCKETRELLEEVTALSDKLHLELHQTQGL